jgi:type I restriction enzyme R subunit
MPNFISEDQIEQALLQRLQHLCGLDVLECYTADPADLADGSGRTDKRDVLLPTRLRAAALKLNPHIPEATVDAALARLADRRQAMSLAAANREVDALLHNGITVNFEDIDGKPQQQRRASGSTFLAGYASTTKKRRLTAPRSARTAPALTRSHGKP